MPYTVKVDNFEVKASPKELQNDKQVPYAGTVRYDGAGNIDIVANTEVNIGFNVIEGNLFFDNNINGRIGVPRDMKVLVSGTFLLNSTTYNEPDYVRASISITGSPTPTVHGVRTYDNNASGARSLAAEVSGVILILKKGEWFTLNARQTDSGGTKRIYNGGNAERFTWMSVMEII